VLDNDDDDDDDIGTSVGGEFDLRAACTPHGRRFFAALTVAWRH